jgi:hypothetical protein
MSTSRFKIVSNEEAALPTPLTLNELVVARKKHPKFQLPGPIDPAPEVTDTVTVDRVVAYQVALLNSRLSEHGLDADIGVAFGRFLRAVCTEGATAQGALHEATTGEGVSDKVFNIVSILFSSWTEVMVALKRYELANGVTKDAKRSPHRLAMAYAFFQLPPGSRFTHWHLNAFDAALERLSEPFSVQIQSSSQLPMYTPLSPPPTLQYRKGGKIVSVPFEPSNLEAIRQDFTELNIPLGIQILPLSMGDSVGLVNNHLVFAGNPSGNSDDVHVEMVCGPGLVLDLPVVNTMVREPILAYLVRGYFGPRPPQSSPKLDDVVLQKIRDITVALSDPEQVDVFLVLQTSLAEFLVGRNNSKPHADSFDNSTTSFLRAAESFCSGLCSLSDLMVETSPHSPVLATTHQTDHDVDQKISRDTFGKLLIWLSLSWLDNSYPPKAIGILLLLKSFVREGSSSQFKLVPKSHLINLFSKINRDIRDIFTRAVPDLQQRLKTHLYEFEVAPPGADTPVTSVFDFNAIVSAARASHREVLGELDIDQWPPEILTAFWAKVLELSKLNVRATLHPDTHLLRIFRELCSSESHDFPGKERLSTLLKNPKITIDKVVSLALKILHELLEEVFPYDKPLNTDVFGKT